MSVKVKKSAANRRPDAGKHQCLTPLQAGRIHRAFIGGPPGATMPHRCNSMETAEFD
jgi:hypothetical protein